MEAVDVESFAWPACFGEKCGGSTFSLWRLRLGMIGEMGEGECRRLWMALLGERLVRFMFSKGEEEDGWNNHNVITAGVNCDSD